MAVKREARAHEVTVFFLEETKKVLWIETYKKFVDILINFLLPLGVAVAVVSRGDPGSKPLGALGNVFGAVKPAAQTVDSAASESLSVLMQKLLQPPAALDNRERLMLAYSCATLHGKGKRCCTVYSCSQSGGATEYWPLLWEHVNLDINPGCGCCGTSSGRPSWKIEGAPSEMHEMPKWHTYIVTENLEVHPTSVAKGMDLMSAHNVGRYRSCQLVKLKLVVGSAEVAKLLRASLTSDSPLN